MIMHQLDARAGKMLEELGKLVVRESRHLDSIITYDISGKAIPFISGNLWGRSEWQNFALSVDVPDAKDGFEWFLYATTGREGKWDAINPQFLVRVNGKISQGFDTNHIRLPLAPQSHSHIDLEGYCPPPENSISFPYLKLEMCLVDRNLEHLIYDLKVPFEAAMLIPEDNREREIALEEISRALDLLDLRDLDRIEFTKSISHARTHIKDHYYAPRGQTIPIATADCIGHTHIDVAWLWDLQQTRRKAARSFSTVLSLMDRYPEYCFMSSQPALYDFIKQDEPELYDRISQRIKEGRWEVEGGMWVEADCNLTGGESLVRQFLFGQRFFEQEFGKRCRVLWLPDVFGYSAALPQLMKLAGIDYFMTTKLSWSEYNLTPYDTFIWKGIDGSRVLTHFSPAREYFENGRGAGHDGLTYYTTYNALLQPSQIAGGWKRFQQKGLDDHYAVVYGYGDGGGGPTDWMLEQARRMDTPMLNTPVVKLNKARAFFEELELRVSGNSRLPVWSGELYLEYHRGTYTAQGHNKRNNRLAELMLRSLEIRSLQAQNCGMEYPKEIINAVWKDVLTLQFHDILPGSSVRKVYQDSDEMYSKCFNTMNNVFACARSAMLKVDQNAVTIWNDLDFLRSDVVRFPALREDIKSLIDVKGKRVPLQHVGDECVAMICDLPPMCAASFELSETNCDERQPLILTIEGFETPFYLGKFDSAMRITSLYDKRAKRELCKSGKKLNQIVCYENRPHNYDAWDINIYYDRRHWDVDTVQNVEILACGPLYAAVRVSYHYMHSDISQEIRLYRDLPRIDFVTEINWQEPTYLLKAHFPLDIFYNDATFDIQYGNVRRSTSKNTSWDVARFEVCAHKWMDISEPDYGVALLNDCKYGCSADENGIALTLLKSSTYPDPAADIGKHNFSYSLLPHVGDWRTGAVVHHAYAFNCVCATDVGLRLKCGQNPLVELTAEGVVIEAIKRAEDGNGIIVRLYECFGRRSHARIVPGFAHSYVYECNILEDEIQSISIADDGSIIKELNPYQILSLRFAQTGLSFDKKKTI